LESGPEADGKVYFLLLLVPKAVNRPQRREFSPLYTLVPFWFVQPMSPNLLRPLLGPGVPACLVAVAVHLAPVAAHGQEGLSQSARHALRQFVTGDYAEAEDYCKRIISFGSADANLATIRIRAQMAQGKYEEAAGNASNAARQFEGYFPVQVAAIEALRSAGKEDEARGLLDQLDALAKKANPKTLNAIELTALGKAALLLGAEPKMVLANFFQKARQLDEKILDGHLAAAEVALSKADYVLASRILNEARIKVGPFPDLVHLQARAFSPSDRVKSESLIDEVLERNPNHVDALLLRAGHAIDNEAYQAAREVIARARAVNPNHPVAWAFEAAVAYILDEAEEGGKAREKALEPWANNPEVDYWIGRKISQKRRFDEGSQFLRRALKADPGHLGAKKALGQDLLRLGKEEEGWKLIKEVRASDKYDVETYNLMLLHDELQSFVTIESDQFAVRMTPREAKVYGPQVIDLLESAKHTLGRKYGYLPEARVVVDFYPDQQDFAIRTLGIPGGLGILGACFGNVIVMNSPGSPGAMGTNWESTLWHEYCHNLTLGATRNRIPRWLTEGISVFEERNRDPSCGHQMTPAFRRRILAETEDKPAPEENAEENADPEEEVAGPGGEETDPFAVDAEADAVKEEAAEQRREAPGLIPIEQLSAALTAFNDPGTIDFAYYQASILVEYLLEEYGEKTFQRVLTDLKTNAAAEKVLARRMASLEDLDAGFARFARAKAGKIAPEADWELPAPDSPLHRSPEGVAAYLEDHPNNIWALSAHCRFLLADKRWEEAREPARKLIDLFPGFVGSGNGYAFLALACRNLEDSEGERRALREWAKRDGDAADALDRLIELDLEAMDWSAVEDAARRLLAINPLLRSPHRALGLAAQNQDKQPEAIRAFESLLNLDPVNPADVHFRLGQLYRGDDASKSKRHILLALEDAPRFREAHRLLLALDPAPQAFPPGHDPASDPEP
jgi:tetratricopeptide (TPR) repeat protein